MSSLSLKVVLAVAFLIVVVYCSQSDAQNHGMTLVDGDAGSTNGTNSTGSGSGSAGSDSGSGNSTSGSGGSDSGSGSGSNSTSGSDSGSGSGSNSTSGSGSGSGSNSTSGSDSGSGSGSNSTAGSGSGSEARNGTAANCYAGVNIDCSTCVENHDCVFCKHAAAGGAYCLPGDWRGPANVAQNPCPGWTWHQCTLTGLTAIILIGGGAGFLLLLLIFICCCCWCRYRNRVHKFKSHHEAASDIEEIESQKRLLSGTRTPMTDTHRDIMREKWGTN